MGSTDAPAFERISQREQDAWREIADMNAWSLRCRIDQLEGLLCISNHLNADLTGKLSEFEKKKPRKKKALSGTSASG
jgi:hypothetical protein